MLLLLLLLLPTWVEANTDFALHNDSTRCTVVHNRWLQFRARSIKEPTAAADCTTRLAAISPHSLLTLVAIRSYSPAASCAITHPAVIQTDSHKLLLLPLDDAAATTIAVHYCCLP
jgi:hypothetical protein